MDMKQEHVDLLLKDLSMRLPYGVVIQEDYLVHDEMFLPNKMDNRLIQIDVYSGTLMTADGGFHNIDEIKPYLFPLSSMTEEQKKEYNSLKHLVPTYHYEYGDIVEEDELFDSPASFQYLIENHFDCNGLLPDGLAVDCSTLNIY